MLNTVRSLLLRLRMLGVVLVATLLLSGCVHAETGITFDGPHHGTLTQHIQLGERLTALNSATTQAWLDNLERRARQVQGKTKRLSKQEIAITIPFNNGKDLETKFNTFFDPTLPLKGRNKDAAAIANLPELNSHLTVQQSNLLFFLRNRLVYDVDLRPLGVASASGETLVNPDALLDLQLSLKAPWGASSPNRPNSLTPTATQTASQDLVWTLQPGRVNHLEAIFWMPNPLGIGAVLIVLLMVGGFYLRYQTLPTPTPTFTTSSDGTQS